MRVALNVNGEPREVDVWEGESLLFALREGLDAPGSKNACEQGECGSCSVLLDGVLVCSCLVAGGAGRRARRRHGRGARRRRSPAPRAGGVRRGGRRPVRLLHAGFRRRRGRPAATRPESDRARDPRGAVREPLPLHRLPEDPRRSPGGGGMSAGQTLQRGHAQAQRTARGRDAEGDGRVRVLERPARGGDAVGSHRPQPARARPRAVDRHDGGGRDAGCPRGADGGGRPRAQGLRARVRRPAGARGRPRALLRGGRWRSSRPSIRSRRAARPRRSSSSTKHSSRCARRPRPNSRRCTPTGRRWVTAIARTIARTSSGTS